LRWFGTDKGISAFYNDKWLTHSYDRKYPEYMFEDYPITSMATSHDGDSLYVGTLGAGVSRVYRNDVDAVTGASEYAQWGPIELPSDTIYSICISWDGTQWFGTSAGAARHVGYNTLDNWTVYNMENGLVDNKVQAIEVDFMGSVWLGTPKGVSVFSHSSMRSFTEKEGLTSNNILCIKVDHDGVVWLGTDSGVTSYSQGEFTKYQIDE
jgi:ligand-binding sensor domain-containing protein